MHCCDSMCVAGCSGGTTESHCVVSVGVEVGVGVGVWG